MEMRKCENGHYYDASINNNCPYCASGTAGATMPLNFSNQSGKTMPIQAENPGATMPMDYSSDAGKTIAVIKESMGLDPVVGWLVCTTGPNKGMDYRIHADNNFIGRNQNMDISIQGDDTISRENHAIISYDTVDGVYYFSPGDGRSIVRYNGKAIFQTTELKSHDRIIVGKTEFIFVPLCVNDFAWMEDDNQ